MTIITGNARGLKGATMTNPFIHPDLALASSAGELSEAAGAARLHRLRLALHDLGLLRALGREWVRFERGRFSFGDLDDAQSDTLVRRLEGLTDTPGQPVGTNATQRELLDQLTAVALPAGPSGAARSAHLVLPF
jgi:hypothetical protein